MIKSYTWTVMSSGSAGAATGTGMSEPVAGELLAVYLSPSAGQAATVDVTLKTANPERTLLTISNLSAAGWTRPRALVQDTVGADIAGLYEPFAVDDSIVATLAQGNNAETVEVKVLVRV